MSERRRVCIESPLHAASEAELIRNVAYAEACMLDSLDRGEAPFLGHLLYPRVLDDALPHDRLQGIECHCAWLQISDYVAVYTDLGISLGMAKGMQFAEDTGKTVVKRALGADWLHRFVHHARPTKAF